MGRARSNYTQLYRMFRTLTPRLDGPVLSTNPRSWKLWVRSRYFHRAQNRCRGSKRDLRPTVGGGEKDGRTAAAVAAADLTDDGVFGAVPGDGRGGPGERLVYTGV